MRQRKFVGDEKAFSFDRDDVVLSIRLGFMNKQGHHRVGKFPKSGRVSAIVGALVLCLLTVSAQALVVTVDLGWGYPGGMDEAALIAGYNLQEGSIVQVIMYNSASGAQPPGTEANNNFDIFGNYTGDPLYAAPYTSGDGNIPGSTTVYSPYTTPAGHVIAYETEIGTPTGWYNIYAQFEILGTYDSLYIRVFGATDFPNGSAIASYWGLSGVQTGTNIVDTWFVNPIDDVVANRTNYFEVIPEPGTLALFVLGATSLLAGHRRRQKLVARK